MAILFLIVTSNLCDRQLINILAQNIKVDLSLSDAELGLLTGTAYGLIRALFSIPIAARADEGNRPRILAALVALCGAFSMFCGMGWNFVGLAIGRMGVGIGESGVVPIAAAMVRDYFPRRTTTALALVMSGNPVGTFIAFFLGGLVAEHWGWRWAFLASGPPGLILAVVLARTLKGADGKSFERSSRERPLRRTAALLNNGTVRLLAVSTTCSMFMIIAANAWVPALFIRTHAIGTARVGLYVAVAAGIGGALGTLSGAACDVIRSRIRRSESWLMIATMIGALPCLFATAFAENIAAAATGFFLYNVLAYAWAAPTIRLIQDAADVRQGALAVSFCSAVGMLFGFGVGVPLIGLISDASMPFFGTRSIGFSLSLVLSAAMILGVAGHWLVLRSIAVPPDRF